MLYRRVLSVSFARATKQAEMLTEFLAAKETGKVARIIALFPQPWTITIFCPSFPTRQIQVLRTNLGFRIVHRKTWESWASVKAIVTVMMIAIKASIVTSEAD